MLREKVSARLLRQIKMTTSKNIKDTCCCAELIGEGEDSTTRSKVIDKCRAICECGCLKEGELRCTCDAKKLATIIQNGGIGVLETDTIYGLVGSAFYPDVVNRIYQVKLRDITKPFIVLISDIEHLKYFGVEVTKELITNIRKYWPGNYSIILPTTENIKFEYLTRGSGKICFRMPDRTDLFELIDLAGPIVAPSANPEGKPPSKTISEAYSYFGDTVDFYSDAGYVDRAASKIIEFVDGELIELRS